MNSRRPTLSVVIPVWNRAKLVQRTLRSLECQTAAPDRIFLVDNNSTDNSLQVLEQWAAKRPKVATVLSCTTPGASAARNCGLAEVTTDYVMFFDSDDAMPPLQVEEVIAGLTANNLPDLLTFDAEMHNLNGTVTPKRRRRGNLMRNHIVHSELATQRYAVRTDFIRAIGAWDESTRQWDDLELGVRLLANSPRVAHVKLSSPVVIYSQEESQTGTGFTSCAGRWEQVLDLCENTLRSHGLNSAARYIKYRRAILAGFYIREGHPELVRNLTPTPFMRLIAQFVAHGGRGVAEIARVFH
jgi:glycosyltransferase involved in cell wall biosynthesis